MGLVSGYVWILPALIVTGWFASFWGPDWAQWALVLGGIVFSVSCVAISFLVVATRPKTPFVPTPECHTPIECWGPGSDSGPISWLVAGVLGFACCVVLVVATLMVDSQNRVRRGASG